MSALTGGRASSFPAMDLAGKTAVVTGVGSGIGRASAQAFAAARLGGRVNLLGTPNRTTEVDFARDVIFKGLTLYGVTGRKMYETWHQMRRFLRAGQLDPRPVITHRFPLECIAEAIQVIKDGQAGKVILEVNP